MAHTDKPSSPEPTFDFGPSSLLRALNGLTKTEATELLTEVRYLNPLLNDALRRVMGGKDWPPIEWLKRQAETNELPWQPDLFAPYLDFDALAPTYNPMALGYLLHHTFPVYENREALGLLHPGAAELLGALREHAQAVLERTGWELNDAGDLVQKSGGRPRLLRSQLLADWYEKVAKERGEPRGNRQSIRDEVHRLLAPYPYFADLTDEEIRQARSNATRRNT